MNTSIHYTMPYAKGISRPCEHFGRAGLCGRPCYNGICGLHRHRKSLIPCLLCGRGTGSKTGYCPCSHRQIYIGQKMKREETEMNDYIDSLLSLDWSAYSVCVTNRSAVYATSGSEAVFEPQPRKKAQCPLRHNTRASGGATN